MKRSTKPSTVAAIVCLSTLLHSCDHKDLCFDHPDHALRSETDFKVSYNLVWEVGDNGMPSWRERWPFEMSYESLTPHIPQGVCVNAYSVNGYNYVSHLPPEGGLASIPTGKNSLLLYNDDTEYIVFDNLNTSASAKAFTRARSRASYSGNPLYRPASKQDERTVTPPDHLFASYVADYYQQAVVKPYTIETELQPLVFSYLVRYEFDCGLNYVGAARGALAGMAESVYLHDGHTGPERATILYDCTIEPWGIQAVVNTFGVPDYPSPVYGKRSTPLNYALNLEVKLRNGRTLNFNFDISNQIARQPHGGVIIVDGIAISDAEGDEGGSGFDVTIDGWGEFNDVIIKL